jgi:hypothetical protein
MLIAYRYGSVVLLGGLATGDVHLISHMLSAPGLLYLSRREQKSEQQKQQQRQKKQQQKPWWSMVWSGTYTPQDQHPQQHQEHQADSSASFERQWGDALGKQILKNWASQMQKHADEDERMALQEMQFKPAPEKTGIKRVVQGLITSIALGGRAPAYKAEDYLSSMLQPLNPATWRREAAAERPWWRRREQAMMRQRQQQQQQREVDQQEQLRQPQRTPQQQQQEREQLGQLWLSPSPSSETMKVVVEPLLDQAVRKGRDRLLVKVGWEKGCGVRDAYYLHKLLRWKERVEAQWHGPCSSL